MPAPVGRCWFKSVGRRERNKQEKLDRIVAAARELFAERGVDEVTTQQIADKADIGTGTLFLYAKTKTARHSPSSRRPRRPSPPCCAGTNGSQKATPRRWHTPCPPWCSSPWR
ncbi:TetR/AcrR family transcriptional regulator [Streptomyces acidiscabies]|uniref:TetR/AcrR family transcriptional regulator n=1 Tax=Streptomyces acidiscabies TaxID=42234 RepID=UPI0038F6B466